MQNSPPNTEVRSVKTNIQLNIDVSRHILERHAFGPITIIAERPVIYLSVLRKHWLKLGRQLQIERARTMDPAKIALITKQVGAIYTLRFRASTYPHGQDADIFLVDPNDVPPPNTATIYLCCPLTPEQCELFLSQCKPSQIVSYNIDSKSL